ncbi:MAG: hypothetical protein ACOYNC_01030 [Bacteroidales bacterium]
MKAFGLLFLLLLVFADTGCTKKQKVKNYTTYDKGNKLILVNFINGCTNVDSRKVKQVLAAMVKTRRVVYNPETDFVAFTNFRKLISNQPSPADDFGIVQTRPAQFNSVREFYSEAAIFVKRSYPSGPQPHEIVPLMQFLSLETLLAQDKNDFESHHFSVIELVNISSYFNQPRAGEWSIPGLPEKTLKVLLPLTSRLTSLKTEPMCLCYGIPDDSLGYTFSTMFLYASETPKLMESGQFVTALDSVLRVNTKGDTIRITRNGNSYKSKSEELQLVEIMQIFNSNNQKIDFIREADSVSCKFCLPASSSSKSIGIEAIVQISTNDPILGRHVVYAQTNQVKLHLGAGWMAAFKKYGLLTGQIVTIILLALLIIWGIYFIFDKSKAIILQFYERNSFIYSQKMEKIKGAIKKWWHFIRSNFDNRFQDYLLVGDSFGNTFLFNIHFGRTSSNFIHLHLMKGDGNCALLTNSSAEKVVKPTTITIDDCSLSAIGYRLTILAQGKGFSFPYIRPSAYPVNRGKEIFNSVISPGEKNAVLLTGKSQRHSQLNLHMTIHPKTESLEEIIDREGIESHEEVVRKLLLVHNRENTDLVFKALVINMLPCNTQFFVSYLEALKHGVIHDPFNVSIVLHMKFNVDPFARRLNRFPAEIEKLMNKMAVKTLLIHYTNSKSKPEPALMVARVQERLKTLSITVLKHDSRVDEHAIFNVSSRPAPYCVKIRSHHFPFLSRVIRNPLKDGDNSFNPGKFAIFGIDLPWRLELALSVIPNAFTRRGSLKNMKPIHHLVLEPQSERFVNQTSDEDYPFETLTQSSTQ